MPVELSVSLFDGFGECICSKGSSSIGHRVDWYKNHRLQSNQFVCRPDDEEEKDGENRGIDDEEEEKDGENRGLINFCV